MSEANREAIAAFRDSLQRVVETAPAALDALPQLRGDIEFIASQAGMVLALVIEAR
jgi:hypothetical protein